jgi:hypothetical protein
MAQLAEFTEMAGRIDQLWLRATAPDPNRPAMASRGYQRLPNGRQCLHLSACEPMTGKRRRAIARTAGSANETTAADRP